MSTEFREARLLELHDAKVRIFSRKYKNELIGGWKEYGGCNDTFVINGEALQRIAAHLGIQTEPIYQKGKGGERFAETLEHHEFNLVRKVNPDIGTGEVEFNSDESCHKIDELLVKIISERLLEIRFTSLLDGDSSEPESETISITYSGSYTVWWLKG
jgi:hypothetical protein